MMNVEAARSSEMYTGTRLHGSISQNTATIVYTFVYIFICMRQFLDSKLDKLSYEWSLRVTNACWPVTRCLHTIPQMQCRFSTCPLCLSSVARLCLCECKAQEHGCNTVPFIGHAHSVTVLCLSVFSPRR
jgi:hypothetical protein